jgi:hypothetical protein
MSSERSAALTIASTSEAARTDATRSRRPRRNPIHTTLTIDKSIDRLQSPLHFDAREFKALPVFAENDISKKTLKTCAKTHQPTTACLLRLSP